MTARSRSLECLVQAFFRLVLLWRRGEGLYFFDILTPNEA